MKPLLILIDGNSLLHRAFYALPPLSDKDGRPTGAIFGFFNMFFKAILDYKPTHAAVAFDLPGPTFRHIMFKDYKATRKPMPNELALQIPTLKKLLQDMKIAIIEKEGFEADDILGTLSDGGMDNIIFTGDRDALQLIDKNTKVAFTKKGISTVELYDTDKFVKEFCFLPTVLVDFKAFCGDASDNIPGVSGIGVKTASDLICKYGSLDGVYNNIDNISGKLKERLLNGKEQAYLSYRLAKINRSAPIMPNYDEYILHFPFEQNVKEKLLDLGFRRLASRDELFITSKIEKNIEFEKIQIDNLSKIKIDGDFSLVLDGQKVLIACKNTQYTINVASDFFTVSFVEVVEFLRPLLQDSGIKKIMYDAKSIMHQTKTYINNYFDVKLAAYLLDVNLKIESLADFCSEFGYKIEDAAYALLVESKKQIIQLEKDQLSSLYYDLELPLVKVLFDMESHGFKLDIDLLDKLGSEFSNQLQKLEEQIFILSGKEFNINSPKQLAQVLFVDLEIPYPKKSKSYSTAFEILDPLKDDYPIIAKVLLYRKIAKLNSTYVEGFKKQADSRGVVHTEFKQALTLTGRLSSVEPNLQNIPIREEEGRRLREAFVAREGKVLVSADYSQIELRLLAHFSKDKTMISSFLNGEDIHAQTASVVFGVDKSMVSSEMRRVAKAVNFGIIYGISDYGLSQNLNIPVKKAAEFIERYFAKFSIVKAYLDGCIEMAYQLGYVKTILGRKRELPELKSSNYMVRKFGERAAMNTPLQGSAADIIKASMVSVDSALKNTNSRLILQIHDELIVEADQSEVDKVQQILTDKMENIIPLSVPLKVSIGAGKRWIDCD